MSSKSKHPISDSFAGDVGTTVVDAVPIELDERGSRDGLGPFCGGIELEAEGRTRVDAWPAAVGPFPILGLLGRGAMGVVYRAHDTRLDREVAIKAMPADIAADPVRLARFRREARSLAALNHPHVATVHALEESGDELYLVLEFIEGETLADRLERGPLDVDEAIRIGTQIVDGLSAAHRRSIVHRDLKPGNVMIRPDGRVKLLDFGIAKDLGLRSPVLETRRIIGTPVPVSRSQTVDGVVVGTPAYMSPEQATGQSIDHRADIWGFGCVLFECLTGAPPFDGDNVDSVLRAVCIDEPNWSTLPTNVPESLAQLLRTCLAKKRLARPPSMNAVHAQLGAVAEANRAMTRTMLSSRLTAHHLPPVPSGLIGREAAIAAVDSAVAASRLVTLIGIDGAGKSRLALEIARRHFEGHRGRFGGGTWFVDLAPLARPELVAQQIGTSLGVREVTDRAILYALRDHVAARKLLIVLDHCDHMHAACRQIAQVLVAAGPGVHVLATCRTPLGAEGEMPVSVAALDAPEVVLGHADAIPALERYSAVELFMHRASIARPGFSIRPDNADAVARVCRLTCGVPLAVELVAARIKWTSVGLLADQLEEAMNGAGGESGVDQPRRALAAILDWIDAGLRPDERVLLRRLSIFADGATIEAAELVCADEVVDDDEGDWLDEHAVERIEHWQVADVLAALVDKFLVVQDAEPGIGSGAGRYRVLEPVRHYARQWLEAAGEFDLMRSAHAGYFGMLADGTDRHISGGGRVDGDAWLRTVDREYSNMRAALDWTQRPGADASPAQQLVLTLWRYWRTRGHHREGRQWIEGALAVDPGAFTVERARVLEVAGALAARQGETESARAPLSEALTIYERLGELRGVATVRGHLGRLALDHNEIDEARSCLTGALEAYEGLGDQAGAASAHAGLAAVMRSLAKAECARAHVVDAVAGFRALGDRERLARALTTEALIALDRLDLNRACGALSEAFEGLDGRGAVRALVGALDATGDLASHAGSRALRLRAAQLYGAADAVRRRLDWPQVPRARADRRPGLARLTAAFGAEVLEVARAKGADLSDEAALDLARDVMADPRTVPGRARIG